MTYDQFLELMKEGQEAVLDHVYEEAYAKRFDRYPTFWLSHQGTDGVRYGSYKRLDRSELKGRVYTLEYVDGSVAIFFNDTIHLGIGWSRAVQFPYIETLN